MKKQRNYTYYSTLAASIMGLIDEKRRSGYAYNSNENVLKELDTFCIQSGYTCETVVKELSDAWSIQKATEGLNARNIRISALRQLSKYIFSLGKEAYLPRRLQSKETSVAHVFTPAELFSFFEALDSMRPTQIASGARILNECKVLFRLYYCCGMRLSEPLNLTWHCVDLDVGSLRILQSKGDKDRIIWIADDINSMLQQYRDYIGQECPGCEWVFPGIKIDIHLNDVSVRNYFRRAWYSTPYSILSNPPTVKSFRHTFVVDRLNSWMESGENIQNKLQYLSKFLGHSSIHESLYYYHQVEQGWKIVRQKDRTSDQVIPEVNTDEKE